MRNAFAGRVGALGALLFALLAGGTSLDGQGVSGQGSGQWSAPVNGLIGRIELKRARAVGGSPLLVATLTLRNDGNPAISVAWHVGAMSYAIVDEAGMPVTTGINVDGRPGGSIMQGQGEPLQVPQNGLVSFDVPGGGMVFSSKAAVLQLGTFESIFAFEPTDRPLFLRAVMEIRSSTASTRREWSGRMAFPDVRIPLGWPPVSATEIAESADEVRRAIKGGNPEHVSMALDRVSLIDDLRAAPIYMEAFVVSDYGVKFRIIDGLGTLLKRSGDGDVSVVLTGLARAARMSADEVGLATTRELLEQSAANLRRSVVHTLARSGHPGARPLLTSLAADPDESVRTLAARYLAEQGSPRPQD